MNTDFRATLEGALSGSLESSAREVLVAIEMRDVVAQELQGADERLGEAIANFDQERLLLFISALGEKHCTWCSFHEFMENPNGGFSYYYTKEYGGLVRAVVPTSPVRIVVNCQSRGDHYGTDEEWQEEHIHLVCPACHEALFDFSGSSGFASIRRAEERPEGFFYREGGAWKPVGQKACFHLGPKSLRPEWEQEFEIPPKLGR